MTDMTLFTAQHLYVNTHLPMRVVQAERVDINSVTRRSTDSMHGTNLTHPDKRITTWGWVILYCRNLLSNNSNNNDDDNNNVINQVTTCAIN